MRDLKSTAENMTVLLSPLITTHQKHQSMKKALQQPPLNPSPYDPPSRSQRRFIKAFSYQPSKLVTRTLLALAAITLAPASMAAIIYQDSFNLTGNLNGSTPDVTTNGATWTGGGTTSTTGGGQLSPGLGGWLPFLPTAGNIYTLSYTLNPNAALSDANIDIGFTNNPDLSLDPDIARDAARVAIFYQAIRKLVPATGEDTEIPANSALSVIYNGQLGLTESDIADPAPNSPTDYQIVLNTNNPTWTAEFLWGDESRTSVNLATKNITRITFDRWAGEPGAVVTNFSLTSTSTAVPEPGTFLPAAALVAGAFLRRRRGQAHRSGGAAA